MIKGTNRRMRWKGEGSRVFGNCYGDRSAVSPVIVLSSQRKPCASTMTRGRGHVSSLPKLHLVTHLRGKLCFPWRGRLREGPGGASCCPRASVSKRSFADKRVTKLRDCVKTIAFRSRET